ncbi:MAG: tRNA 2-thiocytidine biosynthesis protein TtcA [Clostridia bacterium]|nr:tRNA 2-thiocytidine biosynthesis protein TtcA [Clostridia bacterium]
MKKMISKVRCAIDTYNMIKNGDKVAVYVSGGKDSIFMLYALNEIKRYYPQKFQIQAITLDPNLNSPNDYYKEIERFCAEKSIPYIIKSFPIFEIIFKIRKEKNPCSLCSKLRRGILDDCANDLGCNKVALGHHFDDLIETFFMNLFNNGNIDCFRPNTFLSRKNLYAIRPLILCEETHIRNFVKLYGLPVIKSSCPANKTTQRQKVKEIILNLEKIYPDLKKKTFTAIKKAKPEIWH